MILGNYLHISSLFELFCRRKVFVSCWLCLESEVLSCSAMAVDPFMLIREKSQVFMRVYVSGCKGGRRREQPHERSVRDSPRIEGPKCESSAKDFPDPPCMYHQSVRG